MIQKLLPYLKDKRALVDYFILANFAFLALDIAIAHSINDFGESIEWFPLIFSIVASGLLAMTNWNRLKKKDSPAEGPIEVGISLIAILTGILGLFFHLHGSYFAEMTLKNLVYTAPFIAPLSYTGLGFLLILNRMEDSNGLAWTKWILFLALGGFAGNFALSLADHAQNGFFNVNEWIPVFSSCIALGFLGVLLFRSEDKGFLQLCVYVMLLQIFTGSLGFLLHFISLLLRFGADFFPNFIHGAPIFAPLLFANLALLALIGIYDLREKQAAAES